MTDSTIKEKDPAEIRLEIEQTKAALTSKIGALENEVRETVREAASSVQDTLEDVKHKVTGTLEDVKESVYETGQSLTLAHQVEKRPWLCMAGAVSIGWLIGRTLVSATHSSQDTPRHTLVSHQNVEAPSDLKAAVLPAAGFLMETFGSELQQLKRVAIGTSLSAIRDLVSEAVPPSASETVSQVFDKMTQAVGGQPFRGRVFA